MTGLGPFAVEAVQIELLREGFADFMAQVLATELSSHGYRSDVLEATSRTNLADGGIDALIVVPEPVGRIPRGVSVWQFKSGDLQPNDCKKEIRGADQALDRLRLGAAYFLVLGKGLTTRQLENRREALSAELRSQGVEVAEDTVQVLSADDIARWCSEYPALAVHRLLAPLVPRAGITFDEWRQERAHRGEWIGSGTRDDVVQKVTSFLTNEVPSGALRVEGLAGAGKSRVILETVGRAISKESVVYFPRGEGFTSADLVELRRSNRTATLVLDGVDRDVHQILADQIWPESRIKLITIGEPSAAGGTREAVFVEAMESESLQKVVVASQPDLWPEAARVAVEVSAGNVKFALRLAAQILDEPSTHAGHLISTGDLEIFRARGLPEGEDLEACCALALFTRVGFDGDAEIELETIATGLGWRPTLLRRAAGALEDRGLLSQQGRFRSVTPHPVALYLASKGWRFLGPQVVSDLLPVLPTKLLDRLLERAAQVGDQSAVAEAVTFALRDDGLLAQLDQVPVAGHLLGNLAVLAPNLVMERVKGWIDGLTDDYLASQVENRYALNRALEKLAWHSSSFEEAANLLLRLACNENESWGNNSTETWVSLFHAFLPGTSATPQERLAYLRALAKSGDSRVRRLAAKAATQGLRTHESILVAGEVQGGLVPESRGRPQTWGDYWSYRNGLLDVLLDLVDDPEGEVGSVALSGLVESIHGCLEIEANRSHLQSLLPNLPTQALREVRRELSDLRDMLTSSQRSEPRLSAVTELQASLAEESLVDQLWVLGHARAWIVEASELISQISDVASAMGASAPQELLKLLSEERLPSARQVGHILAQVDRDGQNLAALSATSAGSHLEALIGYLWQLVNVGNAAAFDQFIEGMDAEPAVKLRLSVSGPDTERSKQRVKGLAMDLPVWQCAAQIKGWWGHQLDQMEACEVIDLLMSRVATQVDYNRLVDFVAFYIHGREEPLGCLADVTWRLLFQRQEFPKIASEAWDWGQIARHNLKGRPQELGLYLADLAKQGALTIFPGSEDQALLQATVAAMSADGWVTLMDRVLEGSWQLRYATADWFGAAVSVEVAREWVGGDRRRAEALSFASPIGKEDLTPVARFLIEEFGDDDAVMGSLSSAGFVVRTGPESQWIREQIEQVRRIAERPNESPRIVRWARQRKGLLESALKRAIEKEYQEF